jgi:LacI family transcriptional regulator
MILHQRSIWEFFKRMIPVLLPDPSLVFIRRLKSFKEQKLAIQNVLDYALENTYAALCLDLMARLKDISQRTGYSITTVSRALAGYSDVNEQTRQQIVAVAHELGYQPNDIARQLRSQRTQTLGLIIPTSDHSVSHDDFFFQLLRGISDSAAARHYDVLLSSQTSDSEEMDAYRRIVGGNRVDGMILARTRYADERIAYLNSLNFPFTVAGRSAPSGVNNFAFIDVDSQAGIQTATEHIIQQGHRIIGIILPPSHIAYTQYRLQGYQFALQQHGIAFDERLIVHGDLMQSGGYQGVQQLLERNPEMTAVVCCNDLMALGAISALQGLGIIVGQDFAVTGFDDIPAAEYAFPSLTTIRQPIYEIGWKLVEMLLRLIAGEFLPQSETQVIVQTKLIIRESSLGESPEGR